MRADGRWMGAVSGLLLALCGCGEESTDPNDAGGDAGQSEAGTDETGVDGASPGDGDPMRASLEAGEVQGDPDGDAVRFLAIPYAKPPVGELRWKAPEKPEPWDGVRHESEFASACPQAPSRQQDKSTEEDCLYLNVWRPAEATEDAPVMVWFHGGGNTTGSASDRLPVPNPDAEKPLWYDGHVFAERHGVVVVTINYRLGAFGFFAHPGLAAEGSPQGNQGLLDQIHALEWVRDNITAFGGDPENVTIFGQSAGAGDVCMHLASPLTRGLFHRAISQSGSCTFRRGYRTADAAGEDLVEYGGEKGCEGEGTEALECLRSKAVEDLINLEATDRLEGVTSSNDLFRPVIDGSFLEQAPRDAFEAGEIAEVPYIVGATHEESRLYFVSVPAAADDEEYLADIEARYGEEFAPRIAEMYPVSDYDGSYKNAMAALVGDSGTVCGAHDTARLAEEAGLPVFMYDFNIDWNIAPAILGAAHSAEISHVFGVPYMESPENEQVAVEMNAYWARFAASGDPNGDDAKTWPAFEPDENDDDERLQFAPGLPVLESFRKEKCALWREYAAAQRDS